MYSSENDAKVVKKHKIKPLFLIFLLPLQQFILHKNGKQKE